MQGRLRIHPKAIHSGGTKMNCQMRLYGANIVPNRTLQRSSILPRPIINNHNRSIYQNGQTKLGKQTSLVPPPSVLAPAPPRKNFFLHKSNLSLMKRHWKLSQSLSLSSSQHLNQIMSGQKMRYSGIAPQNLIHTTKEKTTLTSVKNSQFSLRTGNNNRIFISNLMSPSFLASSSSSFTLLPSSESSWLTSWRTYRSNNKKNDRNEIADEERKYSAAMSTAAKMKQYAEVERVFSTIPSHIITTQHFDIMIDTYSALGKQEEIQKLWQRIRDENIPMDIILFNAKIKGVFNNPELAGPKYLSEEKLEEFLQSAKNADVLVMWEPIEKIVTQMIDSYEILPNQKTITLLYRVALMAADVQDEVKHEKAMRILNLIHKYQVPMLDIHHSAFVHLCLKSKQYKTVLWYFNLVSSNDRTVRLYTLVLATYKEMGELEKAKELYLEIEHQFYSLDSRQTMYGFHLLIELFLEKRETASEALQLFKDAINRGMTPLLATTEKILEVSWERSDWETLITTLEFKRNSGSLMSHKQFYEIVHTLALSGTHVSKVLNERLIQIQLGADLGDTEVIVDALRHASYMREIDVKYLFWALIEVVTRRNPPDIEQLRRLVDVGTELKLKFSNIETSIMEVFISNGSLPELISTFERVPHQALQDRHFNLLLKGFAEAPNLTPENFEFVQKALELMKSLKLHLNKYTVCPVASIWARCKGIPAALEKAQEMVGAVSKTNENGKKTNLTADLKPEMVYDAILSEAARMGDNEGCKLVMAERARIGIKSSLMTHIHALKGFLYSATDEIEIATQINAFFTLAKGHTSAIRSPAPFNIVLQALCEKKNSYFLASYFLRKFREFNRDLNLPFTPDNIMWTSLSHSRHKTPGSNDQFSRDSARVSKIHNTFPPWHAHITYNRGTPAPIASVKHAQQLVKTP